MSDAYISAELRRQVIERANNCCEYCRLSQTDNFFTFHVDHIISQKHDGTSQFENLCLSCPNCNIRKGSDIAGADPITQAPTFLFHPRNDVWHEHFEIIDSHIQGRTPQGRLTVNLLRFNEIERVTERVELAQLGSYPC